MHLVGQKLATCFTTGEFLPGVYSAVPRWVVISLKGKASLERPAGVLDSQSCSHLPNKHLDIAKLHRRSPVIPENCDLI